MRVKRRTLLRGLTAGLVSLPSISAVFGGRRALAAGEHPRRLIVYWTPNGTVHNRFFPTGSNLTEKPILAPLSDHAADLTLIKTTFSGNGDHKTGLPFSTTGRPKVIGEAESGISIDQAIASSIGSETHRASLVLTGQTKDNRRGYISANADGSRNPPMKEPADAFEFMFGAYGGEDPQVPGPDDVAIQGSILDVVQSDLSSLQARASAADKVKLEAHAEAIRQLEKDIEGGPIECETTNPIPPDASFGYDERCHRHCDLIAASFACDLTRVVSFQTAPAGHDNTGFGFLGIDAGDLHLGTAHSATADAQDNEASDIMATIHAYHASVLAYLIDKLKQIPEGDGTVFDNTAILWTNECAHGNHGHRPVPVVLAGSMGGFLKTGQYLQEELGSATQYRALLATLATGMGHVIDDFGEGEPCGLAPAVMTSQSIAKPQRRHSLDARELSLVDASPGRPTANSSRLRREAPPKRARLRERRLHELSSRSRPTVWSNVSISGRHPPTAVLGHRACSKSAAQEPSAPEFARSSPCRSRP